MRTAFAIANDIVGYSNKLQANHWYISSWIISTFARPFYFISTIEQIIKTAFNLLQCIFYLAKNILTWFDHSAQLINAGLKLKNNMNLLSLSLIGTFFPWLGHHLKDKDLFAKIYAIFKKILPNEINHSLTLTLFGWKIFELEIEFTREYKNSHKNLSEKPSSQYKKIYRPRKVIWPKKIIYAGLKKSRLRMYPFAAVKMHH